MLWGVYIILFNFQKIEGLVMKFRQIEIRNGHVFMRMKKRPLMFVKQDSC